MPRTQLALYREAYTRDDWKRSQVSFVLFNIFRIAIDPVFPPPPFPNSKKSYIPDTLENKFEMVWNEKDDA